MIEDIFGQPGLAARAGDVSTRAERTPEVRTQDIKETGNTSEPAQETPNRTKKTMPGELSEEEKREVERLKKRDREVKQHEMAHLTAAQGLAVSGANFEYKRGPDGIMYAVGGEVTIDTSPVKGDPEATIEKAKKIQRCALAPAEPSAQDRKVAAQARAMEAKARMELAQKTQQESTERRASAESLNGMDGPGPDYSDKIMPTYTAGHGMEPVVDMLG